MTRERAIEILKGSIKKPNTQDGYLGQALTMGINALKVEPCKDTISRKAALDCLKASELKKFDFIMDARSKIAGLPPVQPIRQWGHWILDETDNGITCDKCGCLIWGNDISNGEAYYCPNCGADMRESEDAE